MVDGVECGSEIKEDKDGEKSGVRGNEEVVGYFEECSFCAVLRTETRLKYVKEVVVVEVRFYL